MITMTGTSLQIETADPQGTDALMLLHKAAMEAHALYPEMHQAEPPLPTNPPPRPVGYTSSSMMAPSQSVVARFVPSMNRRMYVLKEYRRHGVAGMILEALEREAARLQYTWMRLETGNRQTAAMRLYESYGFTQIAPFGPYVNDPISVFYEKPVQIKQVFNAHV